MALIGPMVIHKIMSGGLLGKRGGLGQHPAGVAKVSYNVTHIMKNIKKSQLWNLGVRRKHLCKLKLCVILVRSRVLRVLCI